MVGLRWASISRIVSVDDGLQSDTRLGKSPVEAILLLTWCLSFRREWNLSVKQYLKH